MFINGGNWRGKDNSIWRYGPVLGVGCPQISLAFLGSKALTTLLLASRLPHTSLDWVQGGLEIGTSVYRLRHTDLDALFRSHPGLGQRLRDQVAVCVPVYSRARARVCVGERAVRRKLGPRHCDIGRLLTYMSMSI